MFFPPNQKEKTHRKVSGPDLQTLAKQTNSITTLFENYNLKISFTTQKTIEKLMSKHKTIIQTNLKNSAYIN
jgi:hypothetical protein